VKLHHTDDGPRDAPVLLLAGSLGSTLAMWEPQLTLAGPFRVIRVDHRGHGGSPTPPGPYAMPDLAADFVELLDDLELAEVAFCGLSLGGMVGMYLGSEHPHRLTSLTLCCTTAHFADKAPWDQRIAAVEADGTAGIADTVVSRWFTPEWGAAHPEVVTVLREQIAGTPDAGYLGCCRAIAAWDHRARLPAVAVPSTCPPATTCAPHGATTGVSASVTPLGARSVTNVARRERRVPASFVATTRQYTRRRGSSPVSVADTGTKSVPAGSSTSGVTEPNAVVCPYSTCHVVVAPPGLTSALTTGSVGRFAASRRRVIAGRSAAAADAGASTAKAATSANNTRSERIASLPTTATRGRCGAARNQGRAVRPRPNRPNRIDVAAHPTQFSD